MGHMLKKKVIKLEKKDNVGIRINHISLLKKELFFFLLKINLIERNQKACNFFFSEKSI